MDTKRAIRAQKLQQQQTLLLEEMEKLEKKHIPLLVLYYVSGYLIGVGIRGVIPFMGNIVSIVIGIVFRLLFLLILWAATESWLLLILIYLAFHGVLFGIGTFLHFKSDSQLDEMEKKSDDIVKTYFYNCKDRYRINSMEDYYEVDFDDGVSFTQEFIPNGSNEVMARLRVRGADVAIYCLDNDKDYSRYTDRVYSTTENVTELSKHIASTQFNKKFGVIVKSGDEMDRLSCTVCGEILEDSYYPAFGHNYQLSGHQDPGYDLDGWDEYTCSRCGDTYRTIIAGKSPEAGNWVD